MLRTFSLFITVSILSAGAMVSASPVTCQPKGNTWFLVNDEGTVIGSEQFGWDFEKDCREAEGTQTQNVVCGWNGQKFQPYNTDLNLPLGTATKANYYSTIGECKTLVKAHSRPSKVFCAWNDSNFAPFNKTTNKPLSAAGQGWDRQYDTCVKDAVDTSYDDLVCGWNGGPALYNLDGELISKDFKRKEDCIGFLESAKLQRKRKMHRAFQAKPNADAKNEDPLKPFKNGTPDEKVGFPIGCQVKDHQYFHTKNVNGVIVPECAPDTLYSWGGYDKLAWYLKNLPDGKVWGDKLAQGLFTIPSAANSFGYGVLPIRIKVKPGTKFKLFIRPGVYTCDQYISSGRVTAEELKNTIVMRLDYAGTTNLFLEYVVCSPKVIESWSFATEEHFDEILRDHKWMTEKNYFLWEGYAKIDGKDVYLNSTIDNAGTYRTDFTLGRFTYQMGLLRNLTELNFGKVIVPASQDPEAVRSNHFKTSQPVYFNPN